MSDLLAYQCCQGMEDIKYLRTYNCLIEEKYKETTKYKKEGEK